MLANCEAQVKLAQAIADHHNSQITDEEQARGTPRDIDGGSKPCMHDSGG